MLFRPAPTFYLISMEVKLDEKTGTFSITGLTFQQLNTVLNCIMFAKDYGMKWPKDDEPRPRKRK